MAFFDVPTLLFLSGAGVVVVALVGVYWWLSRDDAKKYHV